MAQLGQLLKMTLCPLGPRVEEPSENRLARLADGRETLIVTATGLKY